MADGEQCTTSFIQFKYCQLCKISHKEKNKKHIYSSRHQQILKNILAKFKMKIDESKICMKTPEVQDVGWEREACVWCYFCEESVFKHSSHDEYTVVSGNFLRHLSLSEHNEKMCGFFWENIVDKSKKPNYILSGKEIEMFQDKLKAVVERFKEEKRKKLLQVADKVKQKEMRQSYVAQHYQRLQQHAKPLRQAYKETDDRFIKPGTVSEKNDIISKQTNSFGLTIIPRPKGDQKRGNIFTGATPPWLLTSDNDTSAGIIGPTITEYDKHLKMEKKKKLPENRVGAHFNRQSSTTSTWLPSFGGVWSHQRRLNNKYQFERKINSQPSDMLDTQHIKPYQRKRSSSSATIVSQNSGALQTNDKQLVPWVDTYQKESFSQGLSVSDSQGTNSESIPRDFPCEVKPYKRKKIDKNPIRSEHLISSLSHKIEISKGDKSNFMCDPLVDSPISPLVNVHIRPNAQLLQQGISKQASCNPYKIKIPNS